MRPQTLERGRLRLYRAGRRLDPAQPRGQPATFHWIRKRWEPAPGLAPPESFVASDLATSPSRCPTPGGWATTRFVDLDDLRHDMHVNIVTFQPGGLIPFAETHVMEHGLYVLQAAAPTCSTRTGSRSGRATTCGCAPFARKPARRPAPSPFRYLLYKDVNRMPRLRIGTPGPSRLSRINFRFEP